MKPRGQTCILLIFMIIVLYLVVNPGGFNPAKSSPNSHTSRQMDTEDTPRIHQTNENDEKHHPLRSSSSKVISSSSLRNKYQQVEQEPRHTRKSQRYRKSRSKSSRRIVDEYDDDEQYTKEEEEEGDYGEEDYEEEDTFVDEPPPTRTKRKRSRSRTSKYGEQRKKMIKEEKEEEDDTQEREQKSSGKVVSKEKTKGTERNTVVPPPSSQTTSTTSSPPSVQVPLPLSNRAKDVIVPFNQIPKTPTCSAVHASKQANILRTSYADFNLFSGCGGTEWINRIRDSEASLPETERQQHFYGINVGSNKGYLISEVITTFMPKLNLNPQELHKYLLSIPAIAKIHETNDQWACGSCADCHEIVPFYKNDPINIPSFRVSMYGVEPMPETLELTKSWKKDKSIPDDVLQLFNYAINRKDGPVVMGQVHAVNIGKPGDEGAYLQGAPEGTQLKDGKIIVEGLSVTTFVNRHLPSNVIVDFLLMDMENFDPWGIHSAEELFKQQRVRSLLAEYRPSERAWAEYNLASTVKYLDEYGFNCYMLGKKSLFRITECWDDYYPNIVWGNIVCILRLQKHWIDAAEQLTPLATMV